ncbi:Zn-ribbon containing protein [Halorubrum rubrum]|uniref:Zn-ribbon containing protein n=1 Tax=Halorubrum rubrum TaxID=1126240 RepID=A0ABD5QY60_9EURY|nr:Zn-ribbon containing protein [Halorubrum rubrum]
MPHQCIECGRTFPDGSKEMLSGCPDCGGNKFQFKPAGATESSEPARSAGSASSADPEATADPAPSAGSGTTAESEPAPGFDSSAKSGSKSPSSDPGDPAGPADTSGSSDPTGDADTTDPNTTDPDTTDPVEGDAERIDDEEEEDTAQASARSDVVTPDELDRAAREAGASETDPEVDGESMEPPASQPGVDELRDELNEQFESIKIVSPGQYELNLMELYDRQEYIISLQEDGRYVIEMPDAWGVTDE